MGRLRTKESPLTVSAASSLLGARLPFLQGIDSAWVAGIGSKKPLKLLLAKVRHRFPVTDESRSLQATLTAKGDR
jgi:hypothetical protein